MTHDITSPRWARISVLLIPGLWLGMILGISFIEAPLKFTAPGITIPLGLGIGRRVFLAMNAVEIVLMIVLVLALVALRKTALWPPLKIPTILIGVMLVLKTAVIRPLLAVHTDAVIAGEFSGGSNTHYMYIAAEGVLLIALIWFFRNSARILIK